MKTILAVLAGTILLFSINAGAYPKKAIACPVIMMHGAPDLSVVEGRPAVFAVTIKDTSNRAQLVTYNWIVSNGVIESGQGSNIISVGTRGLADQTITATVEVGKLNPQCNSTRSMTVSVVRIP